MILMIKILMVYAKIVFVLLFAIVCCCCCCDRFFFSFYFSFLFSVVIVSHCCCTLFFCGNSMNKWRHTVRMSDKQFRKYYVYVPCDIKSYGFRGRKYLKKLNKILKTKLKNNRNGK